MLELYFLTRADQAGRDRVSAAVSGLAVDVISGILSALVGRFAEAGRLPALAAVERVQVQVLEIAS
jgi:hypothetical protein